MTTGKNDKKQHLKKRAFLKALAQVGSITKAAELAKVDRSSHYRWLKEDSGGEYENAVNDALDEASDHLEDEARRRAIEGVEEPVFYQGEVVGSVRKFSDTLLMFLLKGNRPGKYKDRVSSEITGKDGGPVQVSSGIDLSKLSDEELRTLEAIISKHEEE